MTTSIRLLYVDDDRNLLDIGKQILERVGNFIVTTAANAPDAIRLLEQERFDAIIADYLMPDMDGIQLLVEVRSRFGQIPFVLFLGMGSEEIAILAINNGADFYLKKGGETRAQFTELAHKITSAVSRKRAEDAIVEREERFRTLLQSIPLVSIQGYTMDGTTNYWDAGSEHLYGYTAAEAIGKNLVDLIIPPEMRDDVRKAIAAMAETGQSIPAAELSLMRKDGSRVTVYSSHAILKREGGGTNLFCIDIDLAERKRAELVLQEANKKLKLLNSITRHDVLNQITALGMFLQIIEKSTKDAELIGFVHKAEGAVERINRQIDFTREYQDIGVQTPHWLEVTGLIFDAQRQLVRCPFEIQVNIGAVEIFADPLILKVFYNLFENAVRHGKNVSTVRFSSQVSGDSLTIICEDDGAGISPAVKAHLFQRGVGSHTGYGLYLSREILSITGITIRENGTPGKGARFEITVPKGMYRFTVGGDNPVRSE